MTCATLIRARSSQDKAGALIEVEARWPLQEGVSCDAAACGRWGGCERLWRVRAMAKDARITPPGIRPGSEGVMYSKRSGDRNRAP
jgi:hypothetical protein